MAAENDKISQLPAHERMTVEEALTLCARQHADFSDVMILAYSDNELVVRSSHMSRRDANWMIDAAKRHVWGE